MGGQQIIILKEGTEREKGKGAVFNNIAAARAVADAVKSTLGPKGMDKMLVDSLGDVTITNDGVTILKEIEIEHPTAKMLVEVAKTQDDEVGDGTTSAVILAGELLKEAESLIEQEVHPTLIVNGYRMAAAEAVKLLRELAFAVNRNDKETLRSIARTAMSGRSVGTNAAFLANIAVWNRPRQGARPPANAEVRPRREDRAHQPGPRSQEDRGERGDPHPRSREASDVLG